MAFNLSNLNLLLQVDVSIKKVVINPLCATVYPQHQTENKVINKFYLEITSKLKPLSQELDQATVTTT